MHLKDPEFNQSLISCTIKQLTDVKTNKSINYVNLLFNTLPIAFNNKSYDQNIHLTDTFHVFSIKKIIKKVKYFYSINLCRIIGYRKKNNSNYNYN